MCYRWAFVCTPTWEIGVTHEAEVTCGCWCGVICGIAVLCFYESGAHCVYGVLELSTRDGAAEGGVIGDYKCVRVKEGVLCRIEFSEDFHPLAVNLSEGVREFLNM